MRVLSTAAAVRTVVMLCVAALAAAGARADGVATPPGWHIQKDGKNAVFTPPDLPPGAVFSLTVPPAASLGSDNLDSWFRAKMQADQPSVGILLRDSPITRQNNGDILYCVRGIRAPGGAQELVTYAAVRRPNGRVQFARILSSPSSNVFRRYLPDALKSLIAPLNESGGAGSSGGASSASSEAPRPDPPSSIPPWLALRLKCTTKPGAGLKSSQVAGVYTTSSYQTGFGGMSIVVYNPILLLRDGTYYDDFDVPPTCFDVAASRRLRPKSWGRWRRAGTRIEVWNDRKQKWDGTDWVGPFSPAAPGDKLHGSFSHIGGGGSLVYGGGVAVSSVNEFTFTPDGHFTNGSGVSASSQDANAGVVANSSRSTSGTYRLDGYMLTLTYGDGRVDRRSFIYMDNKKDAFYLNGVSFLGPH